MVRTRLSELCHGLRFDLATGGIAILLQRHEVGKASVGRLMHEHGPDMPIPELLRTLSHNCPRRLAARIAEPCGVHLPELADIFFPTPWLSPFSPLRQIPP
jgi:hypothetical protein